jgi:AAA+ ATPase superfamily predicted ATPase
MKFIGRKQELQKLEALLAKNTASLVVIKGRRRIGKSRLVEEFSKNRRLYNFMGLPPTAKTSNASEQDNFKLQLKQHFKVVPDTSNWWELLCFLAENTKNGPAIIFFDEISWMATKDSDFLGKLKSIWDIYFSKNPQLIFIICGSVSTWIEANILSSTGFMGRISLTLTLGELPLSDCSLFWPNDLIASYEKLKILSITGGVPRYLEEINYRLPAEQNIANLCFKSSGVLFNEFEQIFSDLFSSRDAIYKKIVFYLAAQKASRSEIAAHLGIEIGGVISSYLNDLEASGFLQRDFSWRIKDGKTSKINLYRLCDNYLRFYIKYIFPNKRKILSGDFENKYISSFPGWAAMLGLQFENLVLNNKSSIQQKLKLDPNEIIAHGAYFQRTTLRSAGCQIDYLIQTNFSCLYVCEVKFSNNLIQADIIPEMQEKIKRLSAPKNFSYRPVLIHVNGVSEQVIESNFFANIVSFSDLLHN